MKSVNPLTIGKDIVMNIKRVSQEKKKKKKVRSHQPARLASKLAHSAIIRWLIVAARVDKVRLKGVLFCKRLSF